MTYLRLFRFTGSATRANGASAVSHISADSCASMIDGRARSPRMETIRARKASDDSREMLRSMNPGCSASISAKAMAARTDSIDGSGKPAAIGCSSDILVSPTLALVKLRRGKACVNPVTKQMFGCHGRYHEMGMAA